MGSGHIAIQAPEYLETGKLEHRLEAGVVRLASEVANDVLRESLLSWAPRLSVNGLASSTAAAVPVRIEGVDPELERTFSASKTSCRTAVTWKQETVCMHT